MNVHRLSRIVILAALLGGGVFSARAEDTVTVTGRVMSADGKQPVGDAVVAVYDDKDQVLDHSKTDAQGAYTLTVPRSALHFVVHHHGGNFLGSVVKGVGKVVGTGLSMAAPLAAGGLAGGLPMAGPGMGIAQSALSGLGRRSVQRLPGGMTAPGMTSGMSGVNPQQMQQMIKQMQARGLPVPPQLIAMSQGETDGMETIAPNAPGALPVRVSLPGRADAVTVTQVYCLQEEATRAEGKQKTGPTAWVDPVLLANTGDSAPARVRHNYLKFGAATLEPGIAEYGQTVKLTVKLPVPAEPNIPAVVVARDSKTGQVFELTAAGEDLYTTEFVIDKKFPKNGQVFCIVAYPADPDKPGRSKQKEDAINGAGLWNPDKPYVYHPSIVLSRNRGEATLTVVEPSKRAR